MIKTLEKEMNLNFFNSFPVDTNVFFGIINLDLTTYFWSDNLIELLGWRFDEIKNNFKFIHPDDLPKTKQLVAKLIEGTEQSVSLDTRFITKSESIIWMNISFSIYRFIDSLKISAIAKKINIEQEQSVAELKQLIDTANAPIFGIDINGNVNEWNQKAAQITGFSKDDVVGNHFVETYITDEYRTSVRDVLDQALKGVETSNYEVPVFTKNGDRVMVLLNATTRRNVHGDIIGVVGVGQDITEIDKVYQHYHQTQIVTKIGSWQWDISSNSVWWSNQTYKIYRVDRENFTPTFDSFLSLLDKKSQKEVRKYVDQILIDGIPYEHYIFAANDTKKTLKVNAHLTKNSDGQPMILYGTTQDVSDTFYLAQEKEQVAEELTQLIDTANAPIFGIDINGNVNEWNQKAAQITGYSKSEVAGKDFVDTYITDEYKASVKDVLDQALKGIETSNYEVPIYTKNGARVMVLLNATTRRNVQGDIIGVVGVGQDITELDNVRKDLTISNTRWQSLIKNESISIKQLNLNLEITSCSNILTSLKDAFTIDDVLGTHISTLFDKDIWKKEKKPLFDQLLLDGTFLNTDIVFHIQNKDIIIRAQFFPNYIDGKMDSINCISSDITKQKELEVKSKLLQEKRESLSQQLLSIQEDERKRVARYVHDEIGQQLASLKISLESQNNSISRSLDQIQGLIGTSRKIAKELRPAQLDLLGLKDAIQTFINDSRSNSKIMFTSNIKLPSNLSQKLSDTIYRVVQEGIENSVKHSQATTINIDIKETNSMIVISIQDNGVGIQEKDFNKEGSFGLIGIEERLVPFNGEFLIKNTTPGTCLEIRIPQ